MAAGYLDHPVPFGFAHQGGTETAPGNTLASFDHARTLGYRYIETDVHLTADGVLVVFHDDDLAATTGVAGPIESKTWDEVSPLLVGGEHPIPRLDTVLDRYPDMRFNIEPKADSAVGPLVEMIHSRRLLDRIGVGSFSDRRVRTMRRALGPALATSPGPFGVALVLAMALFWPRWKAPYRCMQIPTKAWILPLVNRFLVGRYHRLGLQVHVWTINDETRMRALLDLGVDAIISDEVSLLRDVLRSRGAWSDQEPAPEPAPGLAPGSHPDRAAGAEPMSAPCAGPQGDR